jgi:hypothetical protein
MNVLVGLKFLKAANGWTDEEMYDRFCYDVQVRDALGYRHLGEGYMHLRTVYDFRQRLAQPMQERGENLLEQVFEQVTESNGGLSRSRRANNAWIAPCWLKPCPT